MLYLLCFQQLPNRPAPYKPHLWQYGEMYYRLVKILITHTSNPCWYNCDLKCYKKHVLIRWLHVLLVDTSKSFAYLLRCDSSQPWVLLNLSQTYHFLIWWALWLIDWCVNSWLQMSFITHVWLQQHLKNWAVTWVPSSLFCVANKKEQDLV